MSEIKCPHCGKVFQMDASEYDSIVKQVRDKEFQHAMKDRESLLSAEFAKKEQEFLREQDRKLSEKDAEIKGLSVKLEQQSLERDLAVTKALEEKLSELAEAKGKIESLSDKLSRQREEQREAEAALQMQYEKQASLLQEQVDYYRDFKARQSTKMVGESLEQHCLTEFNKVRAMAFPHAYFEKDNEVAEGSKGDFIFRESTPEGVELLSIMFEMKNEADKTATKHKNEDFLKELDKDRRLKGCEYAVLVTMLEMDNEFYNTGIVESYQYEKMYIVRPQFFLPLISLLRNMALSSLSVRQELQAVRAEQADFYTFEQNIEAFKSAFSRNYQLASSKFAAAVDEIDKTITHLQKVRDNLVSSENNLRLANKKAEDLSIKKLAKGAPSILMMASEQKGE